VRKIRGTSSQVGCAPPATLAPLQATKPYFENISIRRYHSACDDADVLDFGAFTRSTSTGLNWVELIATRNRCFIDLFSQFVSDGFSQFGSDGEFCGYAIIPDQVRGFSARADS
jgi:hypothetical protein